MKKKFIELNQVELKMNEIFKTLGQPEMSTQTPWIISKVLRLTISQMKLIDAICVSDFDQCLIVAKRVAKGETVSDIFGCIEFYNQFFYVDKDVFYPRLTTEALVDAVVENYKNYTNFPTEKTTNTSQSIVSKNIITQNETAAATENKNIQIINEGLCGQKGNKKLNILDVCSGTGCVSITLSKLLHALSLGMDISQAAIKIAQKNARNLNANNSKFVNLMCLRLGKKLLRKSLT